MKKLFLSLLLLTIFDLHLFCQDILVLKSGDELKVKVTEVLPDVVKYKKWDNQDGPSYSEAKANIFMIKYKNGTKDVFATKEEKNNTVLNTVDKFLGDWRCNSGSGGLVNEGDELKIGIEGGNLTIALAIGTKSVQNTGVFEKEKIKVTFPIIGETEITYSEVSGKPSVYVFGTQMDKSLKSSSTSAFTGLLSLDTTQALISVIFKSINDEIVSHEALLVNKIIDLLKSNKRIKGIGSKSIDIANIPLRYQLEYQLTTFYKSEASILNPGTSAYYADLRLELFLFKLDKSGQRIRGIPAENKVINSVKSALLPGYVSKQGAFDALLSKIDKPFNEQFYSVLPETNLKIETSNSEATPISKINSIISGSWYGNFSYRGKTNSMQLTCNIKTNEFNVNYPSLGCLGAWKIEKSSDETIDFRESITVGQNSCGAGVLIKASFVNDTQLSLDFYNPNSKRVLAHGTLTKE